MRDAIVSARNKRDLGNQCIGEEAVARLWMLN